MYIHTPPPTHTHMHTYVAYVFIFAGIPTLGKNVVVAGRSKNVGMPIAMLLHTDGAHERPGGKEATFPVVWTAALGAIRDPGTRTDLSSE